MKKFIIFFFLLSLFNFQIFSQEGIPCKTNPKSKRCLQSISNDAFECASVACAMVMTYWEKLGIVTKKGCNYYVDFRTAFGTETGKSYSESHLYEDAFKVVVEKDGILEENLKEEIETISFNLSIWQEIKNQITNNEDRSRLSPWNRPGVLVIIKKRKSRKGGYFGSGGHAKLIWGIEKIESTSVEDLFAGKKPKSIITYFTIDPIVQNREGYTIYDSSENEGFASFWWPFKCKTD